MNKVIYYITMPYYILVFLASVIYYTIIGGAEGLRIAMFLNKLDLTFSEKKPQSTPWNFYKTISVSP